MTRRRPQAFCKLDLILVVIVLFSGRAVADDSQARSVANWAQWRGPSGQGHSDDRHVPLQWSETENIVWKAELPGQGNSSPIIWGDRIFLTAASPDGKERYVLCLHTADGKILWQHRAAREEDPGRSHPWNGYASASCTTDGKYVYAFFGTPGLFCYDFDGNLIWQHSFGIFTTETGWGAAASPFVFDDLVIQNCDNDGAEALPAGRRAEEAASMSLVALDKATGKVRWQTLRNQGRGYSTPILLRTPQGSAELILNGPHGVWAYDPRTGREIWHCKRHIGDENALFGEPIPVSKESTLFALSGRPGPLQAIRMGGSGDVTASHLQWEVVRKGSRDVASPILFNDGLYASDRTGMISEYDATKKKRRRKTR